MNKYSDTGAKSNKGLASLVNVLCPQSQKNSITFFEMTGKDPRENMKCGPFNDKRRIRPELEAIVNRRVVYLSLIFGKEIRSCLVINTDDSHSFEKPSPIAPQLENFKEYTPSSVAPICRPFDNSLVKINFTLIVEVRLLVNASTKNIDGICFVLAAQVGQTELLDDTNTLVCVYFQTPLSQEGPISVYPTVEQYLLAGVFVNDLEFVSMFLGHQGASARYMCMFCLATKNLVKEGFRGAGCTAVKRTIEQMFKWGKDYEEQMTALG